MALLHDVRQFMRQQAPTVAHSRTITASIERDVIPDGEREGIDRTGRCRRLFIRMHPDGTEIVSEARFHQRPGRCIQRATRGIQYLMNERGHLTHRTLRRIGALRPRL
jgi:hypothetical protein